LQQATELRIAQTGLSVALCIAVLAFGGTTPLFFLLPQLLIWSLGVLLLLTSLRRSFPCPRFPVAASLVLVAWVLLQVLPFPAFLGSRVGSLRENGFGSVPFTISIAPHQTVSHFLLLVTYLALFYLVVLVCQYRKARNQLIFVLVALGVFEAFYGLVQYLTGWQRIFGYAKKYYLEEATGTYINRNHFAGFLEMVLPFAAVFAFRQARRLRHWAPTRKGRIRTLLAAIEFPPLVFWLFLSAVIFTALFFSRSRMGIISALASLIVILVLVGIPSLARATGAVVASLCLSAIVGLVVWIGCEPVFTRFELLEQEYTQNTQNRIPIWRDTLKLIHQHPFFGTGLGTFSTAYPSFQSAFLTLRVDHAHCDYLEVASDLGLPGSILVFGSITWILAQAVRRWWKFDDRSDSFVCLGCIGSLVAVLIHSMADFNLYIPANALAFTMILALAWSSANEEAYVSCMKQSGMPRDGDSALGRVRDPGTST
jgi:O-antigen ligase